MVKNHQIGDGEIRMLFDGEISEFRWVKSTFLRRDMA
jgi:hypothetical protein